MRLGQEVQALPRSGLGRYGWDAALAAASFSIAVAIGLVAAFVGLSLGGLWQDELYTGWIVDPAIGWRGMASRALHDVGPPLYYFLLWPFVQLLGDSETGLRLFSALGAVAAIVLLIAGGGRFFSLRARLFAAVMATGSSYWFMQAQNARFYALALLIGTAILLLALHALARERTSAATAGLFVAMAVGSFVHFYMLYESLAVLIVLSLLRPRQRIASAAFAATLLIATGLYVKLVILKQSYAATDQNWIGNDLAWYRLHLGDALRSSLTHKAMLALVICLLPAALAIAPRLATARLTSWRGWLTERSDLVLCVAVPVLVLVAAVTGSFAVTPNLHTRYLLIVSPFLWGLCAIAYDRSVAPAAAIGQLANLGLSAVALWMAVTMATGRLTPYSEPFRESAAKIATMEACRGQVIPTVITERRSWFRSADAEAPIRAAYAKYLHGFAVPRVIYAEDMMSGNIPDDLKRLLTRRIDGEGCPVLAWTVHGATPGFAAELQRRVLEAAGRSAKATDTLAFRTGLDGYLIVAR